MSKLTNKPPPIKGFKYFSFDISYSEKAVRTAERALPYIVAVSPIIRYGPEGETSIDIPLLYQGMAIDRMHFNPLTNTPLPKGHPARVMGIKVSKNKVFKRASEVIKGLRVLKAAEFRDPERAWIVPLAWRSIIVAHVKVTYKGDSVLPDYGLTEEIRRKVI